MAFKMGSYALPQHCQCKPTCLLRGKSHCVQVGLYRKLQLVSVARKNCILEVFVLNLGFKGHLYFLLGPSLGSGGGGAGLELVVRPSEGHLAGGGGTLRYLHNSRACNTLIPVLWGLGHKCLTAFSKHSILPRGIWLKLRVHPKLHWSRETALTPGKAPDFPMGSSDLCISLICTSVPTPSHFLLPTLSQSGSAHS